MKIFNLKPKHVNMLKPKTGELTRLIVNLPIKDARLLKMLSRRQKTNQTTTLVKAIRVLETLNVISSKGSHIEITHKNGSVDELLLP